MFEHILDNPEITKLVRHLHVFVQEKQCNETTLAAICIAERYEVFCTQTHGHKAKVRVMIMYCFITFILGTLNGALVCGYSAGSFFASTYSIVNF